MKRRARISHTPLFAAVRRAIGLSGLASCPHAPPIDELIDMRRAGMTRRDFLKASAAIAVSLGGSLVTSCGSTRQASNISPIPSNIVAPTMSEARRGTTGETAPRIAIVGAGIAGLNAAYKLKQQGLHATVYEGSKRTGGRIFTGKDIVGPGLATDFGGEFIDSGHTEMRALAQEFGLELLDFQGPSEVSLIGDAYFFGGRHYTEAEVVDAFRPVAARIQADYEALGEIVDYREDGGAIELDHTSVAEYLDAIGATGWLRALLDVAYVTEYGLPSDQQSALNLIFMISTDLSENTFEVFGDSDERYWISGGNQRLIDELSHRLENQIQIEHRLEAIKSRGKGYILTFETPAGSIDIIADIALLALPFSTLRDVVIQVELPPVKVKAIKELGYGTNAKLALGFDRRVWRTAGYSGTLYSDEAFQLVWDSTRLQPGDIGGLTVFQGGAPGLALGRDSPIAQRDRLLPVLEKAFSGLVAAHNARVERFHWPSFPWTKGSYSSYKPGQWTSIAGAEIETVGNLFFAGEHCSYDFQGFMNGGAETGKQAAEAILELVGKA